MSWSGRESLMSRPLPSSYPPADPAAQVVNPELSFYTLHFLAGRAHTEERPHTHRFPPFFQETPEGPSAIEDVGQVGGVWARSSIALTSAPRSIRNSKTATFPMITARCRAVWPSQRSRSAPWPATVVAEPRSDREADAVVGCAWISAAIKHEAGHIGLPVAGRRVERGEAPRGLAAIQVRPAVEQPGRDLAIPYFGGPMEHRHAAIVGGVDVRAVWSKISSKRGRSYNSAPMISCSGVLPANDPHGRQPRPGGGRSPGRSRRAGSCCGRSGPRDATRSRRSPGPSSGRVLRSTASARRRRSKTAILVPDPVPRRIGQPGHRADDRSERHPRLQPQFLGDREEHAGSQKAIMTSRGLETPRRIHESPRLARIVDASFAASTTSSTR